MSDIPLTPEQSIFAAENHDLVIKYLKANQLPLDDYYDIVIFGYLKAVRDYFNRPDLRKYAFSTICWKAMKQSVSNHNKGTLRKKRNAEVISIHSELYNDGPVLENTLPVYHDLLEGCRRNYFCMIWPRLSPNSRWTWFGCAPMATISGRLPEDIMYLCRM